MQQNNIEFLEKGNKSFACYDSIEEMVDDLCNTKSGFHKNGEEFKKRIVQACLKKLYQELYAKSN